MRGSLLFSVSHSRRHCSTTGILFARCKNHSVSIDLSNEHVHAVAVLSFYRYPMQLLRTSVP